MYFFFCHLKSHSPHFSFIGMHCPIFTAANHSKLLFSKTQKIYFTINATGVGLGPFDCWLLMRGVKTLAVRMDRQQANAIQIADFLQAHKFKVHYPGLKTHPQYELHAKMSRGPGAVLSFETGNVELSEKLVELTRLWGISVSFGCVNSLIR